MIVGTCHFVSRASAVSYYYLQYCCNTLAEAVAVVDDKIANGSIKIGKPSIKLGERVVIIPSEGRYGIETI